MIDNKCLKCKWLEKYGNDYICGYIAEVYNIAVKIKQEMKCELPENKRKGRLNETIRN